MYTYIASYNICKLWGQIQGRVFGVSRPLPEIYQRSQKNDVLVLFLELSDILVLYEIKQPTYIFQGVAPITPYSIFGLRLFLYLLKYESCIRYDIKHPVASGGLCPQTPCFRDHLYIQILSQKILDPPLSYI